VIKRIKGFLKAIKEKRFLAQGLALQEEREKVKRLEKELMEAHKALGELMSKYQDASAKISRVDKALNDEADSRHWIRWAGMWSVIGGKKNNERKNNE
jgi:hypothetical protein